MSATAAAALKSPSHSLSHSHSHARSSRATTTPRGPPASASVGQALPPRLTPNARSPHHGTGKEPKSPSPSYFGFIVAGEDSIPPDSNPGAHTKQNWQYSDSSSHSGLALAATSHVPVESNPDFEAFRRQSDHNQRFHLSNSMSSLNRPLSSRHNSSSSSASPATPISPLSKGVERKRPALANRLSSHASRMEDVSFFDASRQQSPPRLAHASSVADHQHARLSLPGNRFQSPPLHPSRHAQRSDTLPSTGDKVTAPLTSPVEVAEIMRTLADDTLILDLRVYQHYAAARIRGALNLCIPTTLLKRPAYDVPRLADTFAAEKDRRAFAKWRDCSHIVVYDANSALANEAVTALTVLKKFITEGWTGTGVVIKGGFQAFQKLAPAMVDRGPVHPAAPGTSTQPLRIASPGRDAVPVAGGCTMPAEKTAANPFFGNIRQNMDLLDGVGQMPITKPTDLSAQTEHDMPAWLRRAASDSDEGRLVSDRFLTLERSEQKRMQEALSATVSYGTPRGDTGTPHRFQVAGIEKGSKNRYNNIFPFDHSRVRLQNVPTGDCDYINANHLKAEFSNRRYIATQAPIPATFNDFWRVVWEQEVRVIVMLTAEAEGGQVKSHVYWGPGEYGPLKLKQLSERHVSVGLKAAEKHKSPAAIRPPLGPRRSTTANITGEQRAGGDVRSPTTKNPTAIVRHFTLSHAGHPFQPLRDITQIQYEDWPDFGAPASPLELLGLVEQVNKYARTTTGSPNAAASPNDVAPAGSRPILVHCSAGCGRTGTFCTIDSVIDMLKRQRLELQHPHPAQMDVDHMDVDSADWVDRDDVDLVAKTVDDFRHQRLSMVQNLRQFVLCYESVLQWLASQGAPERADRPKRPGIQDSRRSYQG